MIDKSVQQSWNVAVVKSHCCDKPYPSGNVLADLIAEDSPKFALHWWWGVSNSDFS